MLLRILLQVIDTETNQKVARFGFVCKQDLVDLDGNKVCCIVGGKLHERKRDASKTLTQHMTDVNGGLKKPIEEYVREMRSHKAAGSFTGWPDMVQTPPLLYCFKGQTAKGVPGCMRAFKADGGPGTCDGMRQKTCFYPKDYECTCQPGRRSQPGLMRRRCRCCVMCVQVMCVGAGDVCTHHSDVYTQHSDVCTHHSDVYTHHSHVYTHHSSCVYTPL